ncbi:MAG: diguanylate cyclase [Acetobacteraceae bacterium]|nr:diguanylate cyclase [Acetobacteraceae bacterium]
MQQAVVKLRLPRSSGKDSARIVRWLTMLGMGVALGMLTLGTMVLLDARQDAWRQAEQASNNLVRALVRDIARNIAVLDLSLEGAIAAMQLPGLDQASPEIRHMALFDRAGSAEYLGAVLVLNRDGNIFADSTSLLPRRLNFADRDYFRIHRDWPKAGLYVSRPFRSRLTYESATLAISRRLADSDEEFAGVVVGSLRLAYFQDMFRKLDVGAGGSVALFRTDGRLIARHPSHPDDVNRDLSRSYAFQRMAMMTSGSFVATSSMDGVRRLFTFQHIGNLPLILSIAVSVDEVYAAWWHKARIIGSILVVLCGATVLLCLLFRREMLRRIAAESALTEAAGKLAVMAATDSLTGLANRRQFDLNLDREWRQAARDGTPLALLLLDADGFKSFNDCYGHQEGDQVLRSISACIRDTVRRPADAGARYGGEEFAVLLPDTDAARALAVAEHLRVAVQALGIPHAGSPNGQVTVSIGVATAWPHAEERPAVLVREADAALYEAKQGGRNRVSGARRGDVPGPVWMPAA